MNSDWKPVLSGAAATRACELARELGRRLADPETLATANAAGQTDKPGSDWPTWREVALAQGHPSLAVAFAQLERTFPGEGWEGHAQHHMERAVEALKSGGPPGPSLFDGLAGVGFAANFVDAERYGRLLRTFDGLVGRHATAVIAWLDGRERGVAEDDFDLVSGLSGIGVYALTRGDHAALRPIVARLVELVLAEGPVPGWYTPHGLLDELSKPAYPAGRLNCGLAHGLPGPLALLSLAKRGGLEAERLDEAISYGAAWLRAQSLPDGFGDAWPAAVAPGASESASAVRAAWCYGGPGVARSLWLAGGALHDEVLLGFARDAAGAVFRRPAEQLRTEAPGICHGLAGLVQVSGRFAADSGGGAFGSAAAALAVRLIDRFDPAALLGYRDVGPAGESYENAGLLEGAAGIVLALLAAATPGEPTWDRMLLLA